MALCQVWLKLIRCYMKNLTIPVDHLVMLAELDDKEAGLMAKAIAQYANEGIAPTFSNGALKAIFSLFRSNIETQREASEKRSEVNRNNAQGSKAIGKKRSSKKSVEAPTSPATENDSLQIANGDRNRTTSLPLNEIEAVYPKLGSYRDESLAIWSKMTEDDKSDAIAFIPMYLQSHPVSSDQIYLNQYLKAELWKK